MRRRSRSRGRGPTSTALSTTTGRLSTCTAATGAPALRRRHAPAARSEPPAWPRPWQPPTARLPLRRPWTRSSRRPGTRRASRSSSGSSGTTDTLKGACAGCAASRRSRGRGCFVGRTVSCATCVAAATRVGGPPRRRRPCRRRRCSIQGPRSRPPWRLGDSGIWPATPGPRVPCAPCASSATAQRNSTPQPFRAAIFPDATALARATGPAHASTRATIAARVATLCQQPSIQLHYLDLPDLCAQLGVDAVATVAALAR